MALGLVKNAENEFDLKCCQLRRKSRKNFRDKPPDWSVLEFQVSKVLMTERKIERRDV